MTQRMACLVILIAVLAVLHVGNSRVQAHHAFSAEFDADKPVTLTGTVAEMQWINPHAWLWWMCWEWTARRSGGGLSSGHRTH